MSKLIKIGAYIKDIINPKRLYISNYFKTDFKKKVLISYITRPFIAGIDVGHSNSIESFEVVKIFHNLGYQVDIVQYGAKIESIKFKNSQYDIVFGLEPNFLKAIEKFRPKKTIYYATGAHYSFQNKAENDRLLDLKKRKGVLLEQRRFVFPHESSIIADAVICFGNKWTMSTYENKCKRIEPVRTSAYTFFSFNEIQDKKNRTEARNNFMCLASAGAVHKGLDILLDIFKKHPDIHLYICGDIKKEKDFFDLYNKELLHTSNIHYMGWTSPDSEEFKKIATKCAFSILPSCSEGMNGAIPTCMQLGLIPLVSEECGLDIESCGIIFEKNLIEFIEGIILDCSQKSDSWLRRKSFDSYQFAKNNNTMKAFSKDFKIALNKIL